MKKLVVILLLLLTVLMLTGCSNEKPAATTQSAPKVATSAPDTNEKAHLNFGCYNFSDSIDPAQNTNSAWNGTRFGVVECLFRFNAQVQAEPYLVESYKSSDDYTTWTLVLKPDLLFSNGNPVNATAVKNSLDRLYTATNPEKGGKGTSTPQHFLDITSVEANDDTREVTIHCAQPVFNMDGNLSYPFFGIVDTTVVEDQIVGTGPYKVDSSQDGIGYELSANPHYHAGEVPFDTLSVIFIDDSNTKALALQKGDVDVVENITTAGDLEKLAKIENIHISEAPGVRLGHAYMNPNGPLSNIELRKAILMGIDNDIICEKVVGGMYTSGFSVLPSSLAYNYNKLNNPFSYQPEKAKETLDAAGIVDTDGDGVRELNGKNLELFYITYPSRGLNDFAEAISLQLADIGIKVTVESYDYDTAAKMSKEKQYDFSSSNATTVGTGDPQDFLHNWYDVANSHPTHYGSEEYDVLYEKLMNTPDKEERVAIITDIQQLLIDAAANIVHGYFNSRMISNSDKVINAEIASVDYYWITDQIKPVSK